MGRRKRPKDWHHRVPDFKLVYCGTKKRDSQKKTSNIVENKKIMASFIADPDNKAGSCLEKQKKLTRSPKNN
jgi:hypothetical protein